VAGGYDGWGIVVHNAAKMTFELPVRKRRRWRGGWGTLRGWAGVCQHVAVLGKVEDRIVDCFPAGGGVSYDTFAELCDVRAVPYGRTPVNRVSRR
jgi:hypothetical protein